MTEEELARLRSEDTTVTFQRFAGDFALDRTLVQFTPVYRPMTCAYGEAVKIKVNEFFEIIDTWHLQRKRSDIEVICRKLKEYDDLYKFTHQPLIWQRVVRDCYIFRVDRSFDVKVGISSNITARLKSVRKRWKKAVSLIGVIDSGGRSTERKMHLHLRHRHYGGEFFKSVADEEALSMLSVFSKTANRPCAIEAEASNIWAAVERRLVRLKTHHYNE